MKKQKWYNDKEDLATKPIFNTCWWGLWICCLIVGSKGVAYGLGWESYVIVIFSLVMLGIQQHWLLEILKLHNVGRNSKPLRIRSNEY